MLLLILYLVNGQGLSPLCGDGGYAVRFGVPRVVGRVRRVVAADLDVATAGECLHEEGRVLGRGRTNHTAIVGVARLVDPVDRAVGAREFHLCAVQEGEHGVIAVHLALEHAAANGERA